MCVCVCMIVGKKKIEKYFIDYKTIPTLYISFFFVVFKMLSIQIIFGVEYGWLVF